MQTLKQPYEFLVRWDEGGTLAGAHVQRRYVTTDEAGMVIGEFLGPAEPLTLDTAAGFPLSDLLSEVQIDALTAKAAAETERDTALAERDAALARIAELEAQAAARQATEPTQPVS